MLLIWFKPNINNRIENITCEARKLAAFSPVSLYVQMDKGLGSMHLSIV